MKKEKTQQSILVANAYSMVTFYFSFNMVLQLLSVLMGNVVFQPFLDRKWAKSEKRTWLLRLIS